MKLIFDTIDELAAFYDEYLSDGEDTGATAGTAPATGRRRRGPNKPKGGDANVSGVATSGATAGNGATSGAGFSPPPTGPAVSGFPSAAPAAGGFPGNPPQQQVHPLVPQIIAKVDQTMAAGAPPDPIVAWFRTALPGTEQANWEQMKVSYLPKASEATLVNIASQLSLMQQ